MGCWNQKVLRIQDDRQNYMEREIKINPEEEKKIKIEKG